MPSTESRRRLSERRAIVFAHEQALVGAAGDDCVARRAVADRTIELATTQSPAITLQVWRSRADADVTVPPPT
jgi:hypothetical protein